MRVKLAFWLAANLYLIVIRLLAWGYRQSGKDLATEMATALNEMTTVYVMQPGYPSDPEHAPVATKH